MSKFLVLVMLLWLEVAKDVCGQADLKIPVESTTLDTTTPSINDVKNELESTTLDTTTPSIDDVKNELESTMPETTTPSIDDVKNELVPDYPTAKEANEKYHFEASQQFFYVGAFPWNRTPVIAKNLRYDRKPLADGYIVTDEIGAHKLHLDNATWNDARQICIKEGGHLAIIRSHAEERLVLQMLADKSLTEAWVGYHNKFKEGEWVTVLDEPFEAISRARWSTEFDPNPSGDSTECAQLINDGGLDDYDCEHEQAFFCKIPMEKL